MPWQHDNAALAISESAAGRGAPMDCSDAELMAQLAQGELTALGVLYDRYAPQLLRFASTVDRSEASDVVHNVFLRVIKIAPGFRRDSSSARAWLFAITLRVLQERTRRIQRFLAMTERLARESAPSSSQVDLELSRDLLCRLMLLSPLKREVLVLADVEGCTCAEIAQTLDIPIGTVWTRLHHARKELRSMLAADER